MSKRSSDNASVYADGILTRALDPANQPAAIRRFFAAERDWLLAQVRPGIRVVDLGCGTGRHLGLVADRLELGVGVDYVASHIAEARATHRQPTLRFLVADAMRVPLAPTFDLAICLFNTWGTMPDKAKALAEMRRLSPQPRSRLLTVYSEASVNARRRWYEAIGDTVIEETDRFLRTAGGFRTEHFTTERLRRIIGDGRIEPLSDIAYAVFA